MKEKKTIKTPYKIIIGILLTALGIISLFVDICISYSAYYLYNLKPNYSYVEKNEYIEYNNEIFLYAKKYPESTTYEYKNNLKISYYYLYLYKNIIDFRRNKGVKVKAVTDISYRPIFKEIEDNNLYSKLKQKLKVDKIYYFSDKYYLIERKNPSISRGLCDKKGEIKIPINHHRIEIVNDLIIIDENIFDLNLNKIYKDENYIEVLDKDLIKTQDEYIFLNSDNTFDWNTIKILQPFYENRSVALMKYDNNKNFSEPNTYFVVVDRENNILSTNKKWIILSDKGEAIKTKSGGLYSLCKLFNNIIYLFIEVIKCGKEFIILYLNIYGLMFASY
ncbi:MAG: hypothetical protein IJS60_09310 [Abditibacteriota bacterium]|nr:hypothetical protein [Abditibacteriota bacterium]